MSSFGQWYEEKKAVENGEPAANTSWLGDTDQLLPLFNTESMQSFSWNNMKASMEAQMPKKIMGMGYQQRFQVFCALIFLSVVFFGLAFFVGLPLLTLRPQKFALSFTMGSIVFMGSFAILKGPKEHLQSMCQADRLLFTFFYFGSIFLTLYFTFSFSGASGYLLVMLASGVQLVALMWYLISFLPGGTAGLQYVVAAMGHILKPALVACAQCQAACLSRCVGWVSSSSS